MSDLVNTISALVGGFAVKAANAVLNCLGEPLDEDETADITERLVTVVRIVAQLQLDVLSGNLNDEEIAKRESALDANYGDLFYNLQEGMW